MISKESETLIINLLIGTALSRRQIARKVGVSRETLTRVVKDYIDRILRKHKVRRPTKQEVNDKFKPVPAWFCPNCRHWVMTRTCIKCDLDSGGTAVADVNREKFWRSRGLKNVT